MASGEAPAEAIDIIEAGCQRCIDSADYIESRRAFAEKRVAIFTGR